MKALIITAALILLTITIAHASNEDIEENYGVPTQFRILTPEEVQVDAALNGYWGRSENATHAGVVLEPVLIKCINSAPGFYYVYTFTGVELCKREAMEGIIRLLNDEEGFYLEVIAPLINTARDNSRDYCTFTYNAWDFGGCRSRTSSIGSLLYEFEIYIEIAEKCLNVEGPAKIKLYADGPLNSRIIFGLKEVDKDEKFMWPVGYSGWVLDEEGRIKEYAGFEEATRVEITECYERKTYYLDTKYAVSPDIFDPDIAYWVGVREEMNTVKKENGYYLIVEPEFEQ